MGNGVKIYSRKYIAPEETWLIVAYGTRYRFQHIIGFHKISKSRLNAPTIGPQSSVPDMVLDTKAEILGISVSSESDILYIHVYGILDCNTLQIKDKPDVVKTNNDYFVIKKINLRTFEEIGILSFSKDLSGVQSAAKNFQ